MIPGQLDPLDFAPFTGKTFGIEYEGKPPEVEGIKKTQALLAKVHDKLLADV